MKRDREALRMRALELVARCGLSYDAAADVLGVSRKVISGFDRRARLHGRRPQRRSFSQRPVMTYGHVRA